MEGLSWRQSMVGVHCPMRKKKQRGNPKAAKVNALVCAIPGAKLILLCSPPVVQNTSWAKMVGSLLLLGPAGFVSLVWWDVCEVLRMGLLATQTPGVIPFSK